MKNKAPNLNGWILKINDRYNKLYRIFNNDMGIVFAVAMNFKFNDWIFRSPVKSPLERYINVIYEKNITKNATKKYYTCSGYLRT